MQYDIVKTYPSFGGGISDDNYIGTDYSVQDMDGIDVQSEERFAQIAETFIEGDEYSDYGGNPDWVKKTPVGAFRGNTTETLSYSGGQLSPTIGTVIDGMESYGTGTDQVNYFFGRTSGIKKTNYNGTSLTSTITSGYPTAVNSQVTAIGWHQANILFSKLNKIYYLSTTTDTCFDAITLPPGVRVKYIYSYTIESIVVIATSGTSTVVYELQFNGGTYSLVSETVEKDYTCLSAVGNRYDIYFISAYGIHQYQARQFSDGPIKRILLSGDAKIGWDRGVIVGDGTNFYRFRSIKPGRSKILTKHDVGLTILAINDSVVLTEGSIASNSSILLSAGAYRRTNTIVLRPLDGGSYETPKKDLCYRLGVILPKHSGYTNPATRCGVKVEIMTDEMERINTVNYATLGTYEADIFGYIDITASEIATALEALGYNTQFGYVRTRITLLAGDEYASPAGTYRKTPKLFDFTIKANYVKAR